MITTTFSILLFSIFTTLGGFHFFWSLGGKWGLENVIPTKNSQASSLSIPKLATLIVGLV